MEGTISRGMILHPYMRNKDGTYDKYQITLDNDDNPYFEYVDRFDVEFTRGPKFRSKQSSESIRILSFYQPSVHKTKYYLKKEKLRLKQGDAKVPSKGLIGDAKHLVTYFGGDCPKINSSRRR